jgi:methionyl-tRNA synthetase
MSRILITSALPYISGVKHLGNLVGSQLSADVYARFMRLRGHEVLCICATDEHGTPAELAAQEAGLEVGEFCRQQHAVQAELSRRFRLDWDHFGRSSSKQNHALTQHFARVLDEHGLIEERSMEQVYSRTDGRFLPDRYIIGTCPHCGYEAARGDQCENCTRVLDPTDLVEPRSAISGSRELEVRESRHLYLLQSKLVERLRTWIDSQTTWPPLVTSIARKWLDEGLHDRCITRDLHWGVPVDRPGFEGKVFYVWFDAPIEYIAATQEWAELDPANRDWRSWWYDVGDRVRYVQFMGKDNVPFHTIGFPATILGSGEPWKLVDTIKGFNWLNYYGGKFSTSQKRGVFMDQALELLSSDYWRYSLLANSPEANDATFTWESFQGTVNKDLADVFGNFANRTLKFCASKWGQEVPAGGAPDLSEQALRMAVDHQLDALTTALEQIQLRRATAELRALWVLGNEYLQQQAPWTSIKTDRDAAARVIRNAINLARLYALVARPFIPDTAERLLEALGVDKDTPWPASADEALTALPPGHRFSVPDVLFQKIEDAQVAAWTQRFGGG